MDLTQLNNTGYTDLIVFTHSTLNLLIGLTALLAVVFLVKAGIEYIVSGGDGEKAAKAQKSILYTLLGLVIAFISPLVVRFVLGNLVASQL